MSDIATAETADLIAADKVAGTPVFSVSGEKLGTIETLMIAKATGHVAYAVMRFGGFLGMGVRHHPIPWALLRYERERGGYLLGPAFDPEAAPSLAPDEADTLNHAETRDAVERHWNRPA